MQQCYCPTWASRQTPMALRSLRWHHIECERHSTWRRGRKPCNKSQQDGQHEELPAERDAQSVSLAGFPGSAAQLGNASLFVLPLDGLLARSLARRARAADEEERGSEVTRLAEVCDAGSRSSVWRGATGATRKRSRNAPGETLREK